MSKYTRLNKINYYHDNRSKAKISTARILTSTQSAPEAKAIQTSSANCLAEEQSHRIKPPIKSDSSNQTSDDNNNNNQSSKISNKTKTVTKSLLSTQNLTNLILVNNNLNNYYNSTSIGTRQRLRKMAKLHQTNNNNNNNNNFKLAFLACIILIILLQLAFNVNEVHSLNCYHCSSVDNPDCDEAFTGKGNITGVDCEKHIGKPAKVCRKIVQYIEQKKVVLRSCGYIDEHEEKDRKPMCYKRSGTFAIMMESCNCYTDNCNHSASLVPNLSILILLTLLATSGSAIISKLFIINGISSGNRSNNGNAFSVGGGR